jgi:hypothetical protein
VPRRALAGLARGRLALPPALEVPVALGGTLGSPEVTVRAEDAVEALARGEVRRVGRRATDRARGELEKRGGDAVEGALERLRGRR